MTSWSSAIRAVNEERWKRWAVDREEAARGLSRGRGYEAVNKGDAGVGMWKEKGGHLGPVGREQKTVKGGV